MPIIGTLLTVSILGVAGCPEVAPTVVGTDVPPDDTGGGAGQVQPAGPFSVFLSANRNVLVRGDRTTGSATATATSARPAVFVWSVNDAAVPILSVEVTTVSPTESSAVFEISSDPGLRNPDLGGTLATVSVTATERVDCNPCVDDAGDPLTDDDGEALFCDAGDLQVPPLLDADDDQLEDEAGQPLCAAGPALTRTATFVLRRPPAPITVVLTPLEGSTIAPGDTLTFEATITGGTTLPDDNRDCPTSGSALTSANNGRGYCVSWSISGDAAPAGNAAIGDALTIVELPGTDNDGNVVARATYQARAAVVGNVVFTVTARDASGNQDTATAPIVVRSSSTLAFAEASASRSVLAPGEKVTLTAKGRGGEAPYAIAYELTSGTLGTLSSTGCSTRSASQDCDIDYTAPTNSIGAVLVRVTLTDAVGATASTTIPLTVASSEALAVALSFAAPVLPPNSSTAVTATVQGGTAPYAVCFKVTAGGGTISGGTGGCGPIDDFSVCDCTAPFTIQYQAPGSVGTATVSVKVRDSVAAGATALATVNVNDSGGGTGNVNLALSADHTAVCAGSGEIATITATATGGTGNTFAFEPAGLVTVQSEDSTQAVATYTAAAVDGSQRITVTVTSAGGSSASQGIDIDSRTPDSDDGNACTTDSCAFGDRVNVNVADGSVCNDGLFCTATDVCTAGACGGTGASCVAPLLCNEATDACVECLDFSDCDDANGCTTDSCDAGGTCIHTLNSDPCDDGLFCNGADNCGGGTCSVHAGTTCGLQACDETADACVDCLVDIDCDDANICTTDLCVAGACTHPDVVDGAACDDGLFCTATDTCTGGVCGGAGDPCVLPALCSETTDACVECLASIDCDDGNGCTTDSCIANSCVNTPNNIVCDDLLFCNGTDSCAGGSCSVHTGSPCGGGTPQCDETGDTCAVCVMDAHCDDANGCTTDTCVAGLCQNADNSDACDDGSFCNGADTCGAGSCSVNAGDPCGGATPTCDETGNVCVACLSDGDCGGATPFCNTSTNVCVECLSLTDCDDANGCTTDFCDAGGSCVNFANSLACDDTLFCNGADTCSGGTCSLHVGTPCVGPQVCDEVGDDCVACLNDGDCSGGTPFCETGANVCVECLNAGQCDDGVGCTDDTCPANACVFTTVDANCADNGLFCDGAEFCDAVLDCQSAGDPCGGATPVCDDTGDVCVECLADGDCGGATPFCDLGGNACVECLNNADCDNGLFCDGVETCATGTCQTGTAVDCNDAVACTDDSCNETTDSCDNVVNDANCPDNGLFCDGAEFCDAVFDCQSVGDPCGGATPVCDDTGDVCVECLGDVDCGGATPVCETGAGVCVECLSDIDCSGLTPTCDLGTNVCGP